jgi:hypothetical protein
VWRAVAQAWDGQSPGKYLLGLRTVRLDGRPMDTASAVLGTVGRFANLFFAVDYWCCVVDAAGGGGGGGHGGGGLRQCLHNRLNATKVRRWLLLASDAARVVSRPAPVAFAGDSAISTPEPLMVQVVCVGDAPLLEWLSQWRPSQIGSG